MRGHLNRLIVKNPPYDGKNSELKIVFYNTPYHKFVQYGSLL